MSAPPALPAISDDAVLLHIGVHKTGTTALQAALAARRGDLAEHHVLYPGPQEAAHWPALAVTGLAGKPISHWDDLVSTVQAWPDRVMISSEGFCVADDSQAEKIVRDLAGPTDRPVHVLMGMRPLGELLASSWQQSLKSGITRSFPRWLETVLAHPEDDTLAFWARNTFGESVRRWSSLVSPERMVVVVSDVRQPTVLAETVEQLLGLPAGTVVDALPTERTNRSFTAPEAELVRRVNEALDGRVDQRVRRERVQYAAVLEMLRSAPDAGSERVAAPQSAQEQVAELGARYADEVRASGVSVVGDLDRLGSASGPPGHVERPTQIPMDAAVAAVVGAALGADVYEAEASGRPLPPAEKRRRGSGSPRARSLDPSGASGDSGSTPAPVGSVPGSASGPDSRGEPPRPGRPGMVRRLRSSAGAAVRAWRQTSG